MFYVLPPHHPQLKNVNLKAEATLAKGCLATSKAGRGDAACSSHCSRPARSQTCGGIKGTSTIVDWLFYNVSYALLTSFCMKDNPEVGLFLRGGRKGRKAWEIEEEATLVTINLTTLFPRWSSQVPWLGYSWWIASASFFLSMSLCLYLSLSMCLYLHLFSATFGTRHQSRPSFATLTTGLSIWFWCNLSWEEILRKKWRDSEVPVGCWKWKCTLGWEEWKWTCFTANLTKNNND